MISARVFWLAGLFVVLVAARPALGAPLSPEAQEQAVATLRKAGAHIEFDKTQRGHPVVAVYLDGDNHAITDASLEPLACLLELRTLTVTRTKINGDGLKYLRGLTKLRSISLLSNKNLTDEAVGHLKACAGLRALDLRYTGLMRGRVKHLLEMKRLQELHLASLADADVKQLVALMELEILSVEFSSVTELPPLKKLRRLNLSFSKIGDAGMKHLREMKCLEELDLEETTVGDRGLESLESLTELRVLNLTNTRVVGPGVAHLRKLTKLEVLRLFQANYVESGKLDLSVLRNCPNLRELDLGRRELRDKDLDALKDLKHLKELNLYSCGVSQKAKDALKAALPGLHIAN
jgi:Leucine-rich repeat (LRR) protein